MSRQTRKRPQKSERPEPPPAEPRPMTDADHARLVQRFACMRGRAIDVGYVPWGPVVVAKSPDELREKTEAAIVAATKGQPKN